MYILFCKCVVVFLFIFLWFLIKIMIYMLILIVFICLMWGFFCGGGGLNILLFNKNVNVKICYL